MWWFIGSTLLISFVAAVWLIRSRYNAAVSLGTAPAESARRTAPSSYATSRMPILGRSSWRATILKNRYWVVIGAAVIAAVVSAMTAIGSPLATITLQITGSSGVEVVGTYTADGETVDFKALAPHVISVKGQSISYTIHNLTDPGSMTVIVYSNGDRRGRMTADGPYTVVTGELENGRLLSQQVNKGMSN